MRAHLRGATHRLLQPRSLLSTQPVAGMVGSAQARISHWQPATLSHFSRVASATHDGGQSV
jgi:hypothetical protein